ncbi:MAG: response regulator [Pirellulales bacterium]|nr:response regulator [Pirellulales bacterium]
MPTAKRSTATGKRAAAKKTSAKAAAADAGEQTVAEQASDESEPTASEPLPSSTGGTAAVSKRVLLVDDDAEIVESMRTVLESRGYEILVARDGNQGLAMAESEDPDLVVLDMMMPKRSGFLVLEKLRRSRPVPVRVIMITANEGSRHKAYAEMLGVDDYIRKPFAMDRLLESVDRLLAN